MVDYLSRYRLYSLGYTSPNPRPSVTSRRELNHVTNRHLVKATVDRPVHDCRPEFAREIREPRSWETKLLSRGLHETYKNVDNLHKKPDPEKMGKKAPENMLLRSGELGTRSGDFHYPRGLVAGDSSDIIVADSQNHRVQVLNQMGVYKIKFGTKGTEEGQFNEPTGVCEFPNGDIVVADRRNKRIQVFANDGKFKYLFLTENEPYSVACDKMFRIVVATTARTIEVHERVGKLLHKFRLGGKGLSCPLQICTNTKEEIIVSDPVDSFIKFYAMDGRLLYKFQPTATGNGLTVVPGGVTCSWSGDVIVSDSLNHTVNVYTERGVLIRQILAPTDDAGSIHSISVGPEGHLVATEFSVKGDHCVKIFRYMKCTCHETRPPSSRKRTPLHFMDW